MKVRISKAVLAALQAQYPDRRDWLAVEAPSRQQVNELKRAGLTLVIEKEGMYYYARGQGG